MALKIGDAVSRSLKYGYSNARVKAMKHLLLRKQDLDLLAEAKDSRAVYALLEKTTYRQDLVNASLKGKTLPDQIELACTKNFSRMLSKIARISPKDAREKIIALFERYEIENIKVMLASKEVGKGKEEIAPFIMETGIMPKAAINRMLDAKNVKEAVSALEGTPYWAIVEKAMRKDGSLLSAISALDEYYYSKMKKTAKDFSSEEREIFNMLNAMADAKNISAVLRSKKEGIDAARIVKETSSIGKITREKIIQAANAKNAEDSAKVFEKDFGLADAIAEYKKTGSLIPIEIELEKGYAKKALGVLRRSILSIGAIAGFLLLKEEEIRNIRKILAAKEFGLPNERLRQMLVVV